MYNSTFKNKPRTELKRSYFKRKDFNDVKEMNRGQLNRVGERGRANLKANKILKEVLVGIDYCEIQLNEECLGSFTAANAHRHKRDWYKGDVKLLSDKKQVVKACTNCHNSIEHDADLTEEVFIRLRGEE